MKYFHPKLVYSDPIKFNDDLVNRQFILRFMANRVLNNNKNLLVAVTGGVGEGKSWVSVGIAEDYSAMTGIPFNIKHHVFHTTRQLLQLINDPEAEKKIQYGSILLFEEPQTEVNSRDYHSIANRALASLVSTFRNQRLITLFSTPFLSNLDKQVRSYFNMEFQIVGYNKYSQETHIQPRFIQFNPEVNKFYKKKLVLIHPVDGKSHLVKTKVHDWFVNRASMPLLDEYEHVKADFSAKHNRYLLSELDRVDNHNHIKEDKGQMFRDICAAYDKYGEDYLKIQELFPNFAFETLRNAVRMYKRSLLVRNGGVSVSPLP